ncbi:MAG: hypothetical protein MK212_02715 [Saprospiraceae bacterium]|nr:hypothetical protein [Saprospiraceae bacterium]
MNSLKIPSFLLLLFCLLSYSNQSYAQDSPTDPDDEYYDDEFIDNGQSNDNNKKPRGKQEKRLKKPKAMRDPKPTNLDGLFIGSNFGLSFTSFSFSVDFSPYVGYRLGKFAAIGTGIPYVYSYANNGVQAYHQHIYGFKGFLRFRPLAMIEHPVSNFYLHAEGEYLMVAEKLQTPGSRYVQFGAPAVNVGAGYATPRFDKGFCFTAEILLNVLYFSPNSILTARPLVQYRIGIMYNFTQPQVRKR